MKPKEDDDPDWFIDEPESIIDIVTNDNKTGTIANLRIGSRNNILLFKETKFV